MPNHLDYCNSLLNDITRDTVVKLQRVQNALCSSDLCLGSTIPITWFLQRLLSVGEESPQWPIGLAGFSCNHKMSPLRGFDYHK